MDSGGPLVWKNEKNGGKFELQGIVSFGGTCADKAGVYYKVAGM